MQNLPSTDEMYLEEMGTVIFQSALLRYLGDCTDEEAEVFEKFVDEMSDKEDFIDQLCEVHPDFAKILAEEINSMQKDLVVE